MPVSRRENLVISYDTLPEFVPSLCITNFLHELSHTAVSTFLYILNYISLNIFFLYFSMLRQLLIFCALENSRMVQGSTNV